MNDSIEILKEIYKPYKQTIKNKATIFETMTGKFVIKEKNDFDIKELYTYLNSRSFSKYPNLLDENRKDVDVYEYIEDIPTPIPQKSIDMINTVSDLHNKTSYFKEVSDDKYKEIYENILSNISYLKDFYLSLFESFEKSIYMSPSEYLLIRNSSKIISALAFCEEELSNWYDLVKEKHKQRVALIHNNLELDHYLKSDKDVLISWNKSKIDSPILDLIGLYQKEYLNINFDDVLTKYLERYPLDDSEKKLFFIIISLPEKIELNSNEFKNCIIIRKSLDYLYKTEELVRPYYQKENLDEI